MADNELETLERGQETATKPSDNEASDYFDGNEQELPDPEAAEDATDEDEDIDADEQEELAEGEEDEADEPEITFAEIEIDGKKYEVHPDLKDGYMMQADYTRKTQETSDLRKQLDTQKADIDRLAQTTHEEMAIQAHLLGIDQQLQQYQNVNWQQLEAEDPMGAQSHWRQFQTLKDKKQEGANLLQEKQTERQEQLESQTNQRLRSTMEFAQKNIPGWSEDVDAKITRFAESKGFDRDTLKAAYTPEVYQMLHLAWIGEQALNRQKAAKSKQPATAVKPSQKVSSKANPTARKEISEMSMDEYAAFRNKQEAAKAKR